MIKVPSPSGSSSPRRPELGMFEPEDECTIILSNVRDYLL
jgi:hypothetical protein